MEIGLNVQYVGARRGGAEKYAETLARLLVDAGHGVHVFARQVDPDALPEGAVVHFVRPRMIPGMPWLKAWQFARSSELAMRRRQLDLIIGFDKTWYQDLYLAVGGAHPASLDASSCRFRSSWRRFSWRCGKALNLRQWVFRAIAARQFSTGNCPHIMAPSRISAEHFQRYHGIPSDRISVVYNAVDGDVALPSAAEVRRRFRRRHGLAEDDVAVLFVARNYSLKGLEPLMEAFAQLRAASPRAKLMVCGSHRDNRFRRRARRQGIEDRVLFLQFVDDVRSCFAAADLFALPTFYDPCSLVVLEAMCAGLPVITTRQNGASELVSHGVDGFVIDSPWATRALARAITQLTEDAGLRRRMAGRARQHSQAFTVDARMKQILDVLTRAAADRAVLSTTLRKAA
jgi:UDP-glucose:(heptosyl)LPS alpha-1,3-glucosyltransferase